MNQSTDFFFQLIHLFSNFQALTHLAGRLGNNKDVVMTHLSSHGVTL